MEVHLLSLIGSETIKDMDSDYLHPEHTAHTWACGSKEIADELSEFIKKVDGDLRDVISREVENEGFNAEDDQDIAYNAFKWKHPNEVVLTISNWEIARLILQGSLNSWAESPNVMLNSIRLQTLQEDVIS
jgi:hypothetical protein